jgi:hypothetical protein
MLTSGGTTASGTYIYYWGFGTPLASQTYYTEWYVEGPSAANITGGYIGFLNLYDTSVATISGGSIYLLGTFDSALLDLFGTDLSVTFVRDDSYGSAKALEYRLTGTLFNGDALDARYYRYGGGTLEFNGVYAVPEASSVISLGLLTLGLGGLAVARRRKAAAGG